MLPCRVRGLGAKDATGLVLDERGELRGRRRVDVVVEGADGVGEGDGVGVVVLVGEGGERSVSRGDGEVR